VWYIVTTLTHSGRDTPQCQVDRIQAKIHYFNPVAILLPRSHPAKVGKPTEGGFEREIRFF
jgi:hypothetical protein